MKLLLLLRNNNNKNNNLSNYKVIKIMALLKFNNENISNLIETIDAKNHFEIKSTKFDYNNDCDNSISFNSYLLEQIKKRFVENIIQIFFHFDNNLIRLQQIHSKKFDIAVEYV